MIRTVNEWDPLRSIIVGTATGANWPDQDPVFSQESAKTTWTDTPVPSGPVPGWITCQVNQELDILAQTLTDLGVTVTRPSDMDFVARGGMYNYCPRDRLLIWDTTVLVPNMMYPCRNQEIENYNDLLLEARRVMFMPRDQGLVLDAANVCRLGDTWLYLESASGNRAAYEWLQQKFPEVTIELCNFYAGVHIDSTIVPLHEGLVMLNASRVTADSCPRAFDHWDKIWITDDMIQPQDFYQYPYASKWIAMNMLVVRPGLVIMSRDQPRLAQCLHDHGIETIELSLTHSRTLGGGFHCVTLDTWRQA